MRTHITAAALIVTALVSGCELFGSYTGKEIEAAAVDLCIYLDCDGGRQEPTTDEPDLSYRGTPAECVETDCADYPTRAEAQAALDADPVCHGDLDADRNGIACEEPDPVGDGCRATSNCGCSGFRKATCPSNPCCQWVVGQGCGCRP